MIKKVVITAKDNDLITDKEMVKESIHYKEECSKLEKTLNQRESTIKQQENIIRTYTIQIDNALKAFPKLKEYFGIPESELEKE